MIKRLFNYTNAQICINSLVFLCYTSAASIPRDDYGRIKRSKAAVHEFRQEHPCPPTGKTIGACPGYQIDHITPLFRGGCDSVDNMQWLTVEEHQKKSAKERGGLP